MCCCSFLTTCTCSTWIYKHSFNVKIRANTCMNHRGNTHVLHHYWSITPIWHIHLHKGLVLVITAWCVNKSRLIGVTLVSPQGLTSGKQSLANTWSRAVFPHWLSPTTTILHFTLWLGSMPDFRDDFWHERLSFIDFPSGLSVKIMSPVLWCRRGVRWSDRCGRGASQLASLPLCLPPPVSPPALSR